MRILTIKDESFDLLREYDLLKGHVYWEPSAIRVDIASRVSAPVGDVNFEESMRMFAPSSSTVANVGISIRLLDDIIYRINRRVAFQSGDVFWLHEMAEGDKYERRAAIFSASLQPTSEGGVGALMIKNGWTGLLVLERGAWERVEEQSITQVNLSLNPTLPESTATIYDIQTEGTLNNRIKALILSMRSVFPRTIAVGIRVWSHYYHPILNLGEAPYGGGGGYAEDNTYSKILYFAGNHWTWPPFPPSDTSDPPDFVGLAHNLEEAKKAELIIKLREATRHTQDNQLDDFIGNYEVFLRIGFPQITSGVYPDAYYKFRLGYGDSENLISYNEPVYLNRNDILPYDTLRPEEWNLISLGLLSLPVSMFVAGLEGDYLKEFAFSLTSELIGDALPSEQIFLDSLILMPKNTITFQPVGYFTETVRQDVTYSQNAFLDSGVIMSESLSTYTMTRDIILPSLDAVHMVVMKNVRPSFDAPQTMTLDMAYYERYANVTG